MKRRALVMVAALALAGGACGGDDDDSTDDSAATTSDGAEDSADAGDDDATDDDAGDDGGSNDSDWCELARRVEAEDDLLEGVDFTDPEALEDAYQLMIDLVEDAAGEAPDEIRDDIDLVVDRSNLVFEALRDADFNILDVDQSVFEDAEADAASERIEAYNAAECGIAVDDIDDGETGDTDDADVTDDSTADAGDDADDVLSGEGTIGEELVRQFTAMGMTEDQADCMVDNLDMEEVAASGADNPSMFLDLFETCDIELTDLQTGG